MPGSKDSGAAARLFLRGKDGWAEHHGRMESASLGLNAKYEKHPSLRKLELRDYA